MSFLESIQHGLEKASQEATRIAKIQHLHNVANDLTFKTSQQGQSLVGKAMEMYHQGILAQGELTAICQQIATYEQQLTEVHEELQKLQTAEDATSQQTTPVPPTQAGYPTPAPQAGYPAYPAQPGYPAYPTPQPGYAYPAQAGYPAYPGTPVPPAYPAAPAGKIPTQPLSAVPAQQSAADTQAQAAPHKSPVHHLSLIHI